MSIIKHVAPSVETMLLMSTLNTSMSAVGVPTSSGYFILSPPAVSRVLSFSALFGL